MNIIDGKKVEYLRQKKNLSQEEFGKKLNGLSKYTISNWENYRKSIPPKYHDEICKILKVTIDDLKEDAEGVSYQEIRSSINNLVEKMGSEENMIGVLTIPITIFESWKKHPYKDIPFSYWVRLKKEFDKYNIDYPLAWNDPISVPRVVAKDIKDDLVPASNMHSVPVLTEAQAKSWDAEYDGILEHVDLDLCEKQFFFGSDIKEGWVAVRVNGTSGGSDLPHGSYLLVDMDTPYPKRGKRVLAKTIEGELIVKRYFRKDNVIRLESDGEGRRWEWHIKEDESPIEWMRPVKQILLIED